MALSSKENWYYFFREILWLAITALVIYLLLFPITSKVYFIYWKINVFFIFLTITYFRYATTFKSLPFLKPSWIRFILFAVNFYLEDFGFPKVFITESVKRDLFKYMYTEIVLFSTGSLITLSAFQLRLILSYWQYYKHQANLLLED